MKGKFQAGVSSTEDTAGRCGRRLQAGGTPTPGTLWPHQCANPESSTCPRAVGQLPLSPLSHNPAMSPDMGMEPLSYVPLHYKRRALRTTVHEMGPTSVPSCPLSRSPAPCPRWYSCSYSPSGRRDRAHVLDGDVREQGLKKTGPLTWEVLSPGRE